METHTSRRSQRTRDRQHSPGTYRNTLIAPTRPWQRPERWDTAALTTTAFRPLPALPRRRRRRRTNRSCYPPLSQKPQCLYRVPLRSGACLPPSPSGLPPPPPPRPRRAALPSLPGGGEAGGGRATCRFGRRLLLLLPREVGAHEGPSVLLSGELLEAGGGELVHLLLTLRPATQWGGGEAGPVPARRRLPAPPRPRPLPGAVDARPPALAHRVEHAVALGDKTGVTEHRHEPPQHGAAPPPSAHPVPPPASPHPPRPPHPAAAAAAAGPPSSCACAAAGAVREAEGARGLRYGPRERPKLLEKRRVWGFCFSPIMVAF